MFSNLMGWLEKSPPPGNAERAAIAQAVTIVDPMLKMVSGFERRLAPAVRHALAYCDGLVAAVPGPVDLNSHAFASDPLVHALFATAGDIAVTFGKSKAVKEFLGDPASAGSADFYALLGMRRFEKKVMGMALHGEMVCADMPQTMLYFADHTLHALTPDVNETRTHLRQAAFDSLITGFAAHMADLRRERQSLHDEWDMQRAMAARDKQGGANSADSAHAQRRQVLEEQMRQASSALSPERVLEALAEWLAAPEIHLYLNSNTVSVDRMGVMVGPDSPDSNDTQVSTLSFPELIGRDRRHWIVLLTRISREEAVSALQQQLEASRYLII